MSGQPGATSRVGTGSGVRRRQRNQPENAGNCPVAYAAEMTAELPAPEPEPRERPLRLADDQPHRVTGLSPSGSAAR